MIQPTTLFEQEGQTDFLAARYFIVQHVSDPFRREPRNVGVVVRKGDSVTARFVGEDPETGEFDVRTLRHVVKSPKAYRMWVRHWRKLLNSEGPEACDRIVGRSTPHLSVIPAGDVAQTGQDSVLDICSYLYSVLVSTGGLREALGAADMTEPVAELTREIVSDLRAAGIMASIAGPDVRNPVYIDREVRGAKHWHNVSLFQETKHAAWVVEPVNFATPQKGHAKERAGYTSYVFADLRGAVEEGRREMNTVTLYRATPSDLESKVVQYALSLLRDNSTLMINWLDEGERKRFVERRLEIALAA